MERLPHSDCTGHNVIVHDAVLWRGVRALQRDGAARYYGTNFARWHGQCGDTRWPHSFQDKAFRIKF